MKMKQLKKLLSLILCVALIAAVALSVIGCGDNSKGSGETNPASQTGDGTGTQENPESGDEVVGEGAKSFHFVVADINGNETKFVVKTDKDTVGDALLENGLIEGEDGSYGLYVKVVNGITADYDTDGTYWAFYVNGEYAMTGVDSTEITDGETYSFRVSK